MLKNTFSIVSITKPEPLNDPSINDMILIPIDRIRSGSDEWFEEFIVEWAVACAKQRYIDVYRIGGAGDKGRDVLGEYEDGKFDYYQCKKYNKPLQPSEYWIEFGKLCYFTFKEEIPIPRKYYIIAANDLSPKMRKLIHNKDGIRDGLMTEWQSKCSKKIIENQEIKLEGEFLEYVKEFNFSIIDTYSMNAILEEHRLTNYFYFRFGGNKKPERKIVVDPPKQVSSEEQIYSKKILEAYSEHMKKTVTMSTLHEYEDLQDDFNYRRIEFYSAESLKRNIRDIFSTEDEFGFLKKEMYSGIRDFIQDEFKDGFEKMRRSLHEATNVSLVASKIESDLKIVLNDDRKGLCHHLANDNLIHWRTKK